MNESRVNPQRQRAACAAWRALPAGLLLAVALCGDPALAASEQMLFTRLGADDGLSQGSVTAIQQDAAGFVWIGTEDGLNRFDGHEVRHVVRDRKDARSLPNNWISAIARDARGHLYVATGGGGVVWRDAVTGSFRPVTAADGRALLDPQGNARTLRFDRAGRLWVGARGNGVSVIDERAGTSHQYRRDQSDAGTLSDDSVLAFAEDADGGMWVASDGGLDRVDLAADTVVRWSTRLRAVLPPNAALRVAAVEVDDRGMVWIATGAGLARLDPASGAITTLRHRANDPRSLPDDRVTALLQDSQRRIWVGTARGLALLDRRAESFTVLREDPGDTTSLPDDHVTDLFEDRGGLLWVGTKSGGVARWNPRSWSFGHRRLGDGAVNNVAAFAEDRSGRLWIGTVGGGLLALDRDVGSVVRYGTEGPARTRIGDDNVMAVIVDARDRVWAGTMGAGVVRIDPRSGRIERFAHRPDDPNSLGAPGVMALAADARGNVWAGTFGGGVARIDASDDSVRRFGVDRDGTKGLSSDRATAIAEDHGGLIWIGTDGGGLNVLDPATGRFRHFRHDPRGANSLAADTVYDIHVDETGQVWIGTRGGGLDRARGAPFSGPALTFENYSETDGLPNSTVYGIESVGKDRLWLSTNRGLSRLDVRQRRFTNFRRGHGLQGDEFNFGAHYVTASGELFFGGANGYNAFFGERLQGNPNAPPVVITEILRLNMPADLGIPHETVKTLRLGHRDDVVAFRFAGLDYSAPNANRYAYKLEGFDADWVDAGAQRQVTYTDLDGGDYVLRVKAANSDGVWNETGASVALAVEPPPWRTWWANLLYGLVIALLLGAVWFLQQRRILREAEYKHRLELEVEERTAEINLRNGQLEDANRQLRDASITDPLTGLGNRRALYEVVSRLHADAQDAVSGARPRFSLMMVDLDRLKPINDQFGHEAGDRVLVQVAEVLRSVSRSTDHVVRWGGDEFLLLCRDLDIAAAAELAERVRSSVSKQIFRVGEGAATRTSCSVGFAVFPFVPALPDRGDWEQSLAMADAALYQAKRLRNTWVGWRGTARIAEVESLQDAVERDATALEEGGYIETYRPPPRHDETVDRLRILGGAPDR